MVSVAIGRESSIPRYCYLWFSGDIEIIIYKGWFLLNTWGIILLPRKLFCWNCEIAPGKGPSNSWGPQQCEGPYHQVSKNGRIFMRPKNCDKWFIRNHSYFQTSVMWCLELFVSCLFLWKVQLFNSSNLLERFRFFCRDKKSHVFFKWQNSESSYDTGPQTMHYYKGNLSKLPHICIVWSPHIGSHLVTPLVERF